MTNAAMQLISSMLGDFTTVQPKAMLQKMTSFLNLAHIYNNIMTCLHSDGRWMPYGCFNIIHKNDGNIIK